MVQSVFEFVNILVFSEMHGFHPVFCGIYVGIRPFSWESFKDGRRNLHSGVSSSSESGFKSGSGMIPPCAHLHRAC